MDAEMIAVDHLNSEGVGATAYYDVPTERPDAFIVVERTGGARGGLVVDTPTLDVQCWARSRRAASELADSVEEALARMPDALPNCFGARVASRYRDFDIDSGTPRYHVIVELTLND